MRGNAGVNLPLEVSSQVRRELRQDLPHHITTTAAPISNISIIIASAAIAIPSAIISIIYYYPNPCLGVHAQVSCI